jgi:hypothetical protein
MKKVLISMAAGAMSLGSAIPALGLPEGPEDNNGESDSSIWEIIDQDLGDDGEVIPTSVFETTDDLADLILIAGMATMLDTCGNGKPFYTLFAPVDEWDKGEGLLDVLDATIAELQASPAVVRSVINDHLVNGSFSPWQLDLDEITTLTARSGFTLRNENGDTINDQIIGDSEQACNGWIYYIDGFIDSTPQVSTEGLNSLDTPNDGTPGGSNSLPDTL